MPIEIEKLHEASKPLGERIRAFLKNQSRQAFTLEEIYGEMEGYSPESARMLMALEKVASEGGRADVYFSTLEKLIAEGSVTSATYQGSVYYAAAG